MDFVNPEGGDSILSETLPATNWQGIIFQKNLIFNILIFDIFEIFVSFILYFYLSLLIPLFLFIHSLLRYLSFFLCPFFTYFFSLLFVSFIYINFNPSLLHYFLFCPLVSSVQ
jgi:hypothetical protein